MDKQSENIQAKEYIDALQLVEDCEKKSSSGSTQFEGYKVHAADHALTQNGFKRARDDEGCHTENINMLCYRKAGWRAEITTGNFLGSFTQVDIFCEFP